MRNRLGNKSVTSVSCWTAGIVGAASDGRLKKRRVRNSASSKGLLVARASDPSPAHAANIGRGAAQRAVCSPPARKFYSKWSESDRPFLHCIITLFAELELEPVAEVM